MHPVQTFRNLKQTFWFLPSVLFASSVVLYVITIFIDARFATELDNWLPQFVTGSPDAARVLLSTIAGSVITVVSISFSITLLAFQQTATQYSSRVLRTLTQKPSFQIVLGTYIGTFLYALLVLRSVAGTSGVDSTDFVPTISILVALTLTVVCMGLLVYFINSVVRSLQAAEIVRHVHVEILEQLKSRYPEKAEKAKNDDEVEALMRQTKHRKRTLIYAKESGFLVTMSESKLQGVAAAEAQWIRILPKVGSFIIYGELLAEVSGTLTKAEEQCLRASFVVDYQRSTAQDPLFPYRQLVDIALKALSPALNETTTGEYCLMRLADGLARLMQQRFPDDVYRIQHEGNIMPFIFPQATWADFVDLSFTQMIRQASGNEYMLRRIGEVLHELERQATTDAQREPIVRVQQKLLAYR